MSDLIKEDDEFLYLRQYVHYDSDSLSDWMYTKRDANGEWGFKYPENIINAAHTACYEIEVRYRVRKSDAKVFYDEITP